MEKEELSFRVKFSDPSNENSFENISLTDQWNFRKTKKILSLRHVIVESTHCAASFSGLESRCIPLLFKLFIVRDATKYQRAEESRSIAKEVFRYGSPANSFEINGGLTPSVTLVYRARRKTAGDLRGTRNLRDAGEERQKFPKD